MELGFSPIETLNIYGQWIKTELDEESDPSWGLTDDEWSSEFNIYCEWTASDNLWVHLGAGFSVPDDAEEAVYGGNDDTAYFAQLWFWFYF